LFRSKIVRIVLKQGKKKNEKMGETENVAGLLLLDNGYLILTRNNLNIF